MQLALTSADVRLILGATTLVLVGLGVYAMVRAWKDQDRRSPRCRRCLYPIDETRKLNCPECGWSTSDDKRLYFRKIKRRWAACGVLLFLLASTAWYGRYVEERVNSMYEPLALAVVPTTLYTVMLNHFDGSNDQDVMLRFNHQGWDWQQRWIERRYHTLFRDDSQPTQRLTDSIRAFWATEVKPLSIEDVDRLIGLLERQDQQLSLSVLVALTRATPPDARVAEATFEMMKVPYGSNTNAFESKLYASYLFGRHQTDTQFDSVQLLGLDDQISHFQYFNGVLSRTFPFDPEDPMPAFVLSKSYAFLLDRLVAPPGATGQHDAAKALADHLSYSSSEVYTLREKDPTAEEIDAIYRVLTTALQDGPSNGAFKHDWDYSSVSYDGDENLCRLLLGLAVQIIKQNGPDDPRVAVLINQFLHPQFGYGNGIMGGGLEQIPECVKRGDMEAKVAADLGRAAIAAMRKMHKIPADVEPFAYTPDGKGGAKLKFTHGGLLIPEYRDDIGGLEVYEMWEAAKALIALDDDQE